MNPKVQIQTINALMGIASHHGEYLGKLDEALGVLVRTVKDLQERVAKLEAVKPAEPADNA